MISLWKRFRSWDKKISREIKRDVFGDYVFSKLIFRGVIVVLFLLALVSIGLDGFGGEYVFCQSTGYVVEYGVYCEYPGHVIGDERSFFTKQFGLVSFLFVVLGFILNHLFYNYNKEVQGK